MIQSPCVRNCCLNEADYCLGCFRSLEEICNWNSYSEEAKKMIIVVCEKRRKQELNFWQKI
ncbi:MAG: DUF1289 domain-containing protein [Thiohalomonadales bacterium]